MNPQDNPETLEHLSNPEDGEKERQIDVVADSEGNFYRIVGNQKEGPLETREVADENDPGAKVIEVAIHQEDNTVEWLRPNVLPYSAENYEGGDIYGDLNKELEDNGEGAKNNPDRIRVNAQSNPESENGATISKVGGRVDTFSRSISNDIGELDPDLNKEATLDEYRAKLTEKLANISDKLRISSAAVDELLVGGEKDALARVRSELIDDISGQIEGATDKNVLEVIERKYFQGSGDTDTENIAAGLSIDASLSGFNLALGRVKNIPALMEFCRSITTGREQPKIEALAAEQSGDEEAAHKAYEAVAESLGTDDKDTLNAFLHGGENPDGATGESADNKRIALAA